MKSVLAALKLSSEASEGAALTALSELTSALAANDAEIAALKANQFDAGKHIPLTEHGKVTAELAALKLAADESTRAALYEAACADSYILPVNAAYWAKQPLAALTEFLKDAKPCAALSGTQTGGTAPAGGGVTAALTDVQKQAATALGMSVVEYAKALTA